MITYSHSPNPIIRHDRKIVLISFQNTEAPSKMQAIFEKSARALGSNRRPLAGNPAILPRGYNSNVSTITNQTKLDALNNEPAWYK